MLELSVKLRQGTSRQNKQFRKQGFIPAILYGRKVKNLSLLIKAQDFEKVYQEAGESTLIKLKIRDDKELKSGGGKDRTVLVHDTARDPITDKIIHIDFRQVRLDEATTVEVSLVFVGKSAAVEKEGGVLIRNIQDLEMRALPQDLPHEIEVDISPLKTFDDNIYIKDLKIPDKVEITANPEDVVASVIPPRTKAALEELEEAPVEEVEEVEIEEKGKEKEEVKEQVEEPTKEKEESKFTKGDSGSGGE